MKGGTPRLSSGELDLMDLLWREGPLTLAQAHQRFADGSVGYTTVQTRLNRLVEKGLATRSADRPASYSAAIERKAARAGHLDQWVNKLAGGSVVPLVAQLVHDRRISADELDELKKLIDAAQAESMQGGQARASQRDSGSRKR